MRRASLHLALLGSGLALIAAGTVGALVASQSGRLSAELRGATQGPPAPSAGPEVPTRAHSATLSPGPPMIVVPRLRLKSRVYGQQDPGPAWWPYSGRPGGGDTIAIAGHRQTHTHPFLRIDRLRPGDRVYLRWRGRWHAYAVTGHRILSARHMYIARPRGHEVLILSACTRWDGTPTDARYRYVVYARPA